jgi:exodeoxyribonuclease VII large subunit
VAAPTPSAAAEVCVPSIAELAAQVASLGARLRWSLTDQQSQAASQARAAEERLRRQSPSPALQARRRTVDDQAARLKRATATDLAARAKDVSAARSLLGALDPDAVLRRGYASIQRSVDGRSVFSMSQVTPGEQVVAFLQDGSFSAIVDRAGSRSGKAAR